MKKIIASMGACFLIVVAVLGGGLSMGLGKGVAAALPEVTVLQEDQHEFRPALQLLEDTAGELTLAEVREAEAAGKFMSSPAEIPNFGYGAPAQWAKMTFRNETERTEWLLSVAYPPLDELQLYTVYEDGTTLTATSGDVLRFAERQAAHRNHLFPLQLPTGDDVTLYMRVESEGALALPITLLDSAGYVEEEQASTLLLGGYYGIMLIMIVYNSVLALTLRSKPYLYYVFMNLSTLLLYVTLNGVAYQYIWPEAVWWNNRAIVFFICLSHIAAMLFTRSILKMRRANVKLYHIFSLLIAVEVINIAVLFYSYSIGLKLSLYSIVVIQLMMIAAAIGGWRQGSQTAKFFLLGWGVFMAGALASSLTDAGIIPMAGWSIYASQAGSAFQAVVLSWGLAEHLQHIRREKETAVEQMKESRRLAHTDDLTGLYNRRYVVQAFEHAVRARPGRTMSLMMVDVDHFKKVNDTYGHDMGDRILKELAVLMRSGLPRTDVIGRFGGEEFMVLLPDTMLEHARIAADRLIGAVREHPFAADSGQSLYCTVSIGIAQWKGGEETFLQLLRRADEALYEAKSEGRNRVMTANMAG